MEVKPFQFIIPFNPQYLPKHAPDILQSGGCQSGGCWWGRTHHFSLLTFILKKEDFKELYRKCRISGIVGNIRIYENSLIIQKYFRTPLKRGKKFSYPVKMLQNILVPPLFHSTPVPGIKNDRSLTATSMCALFPVYVMEPFKYRIESYY